MVYLIDHFDSFVFNLARYIQELGFEVCVVRQNEVSLAQIQAMQPSHIVLSPGPCGPAQASISLEVVKMFRGQIPILGVCLGHQILGHAFGGKVMRAVRPLHGQSRPLIHEGWGLFAGIPSPCQVGRYHSLIVSDEGLSPALRVIARSEEGEIMAFVSEMDRVAGVQFHPESVLTSCGHQLLSNFLEGEYLTDTARTTQ